MDNLWVAYSVDHEKGDIAQILGCFNSKERAYEKILSSMQSIFQIYCLDEGHIHTILRDPRFSAYDENITWNDIQKILEKELVKKKSVFFWNDIYYTQLCKKESPGSYLPKH